MTEHFFYWNNVKYKLRHYQFDINLLKRRKVTTKTKFYKKIIKKSKTTRASKVFKLYINFNVFTSMPPLSTFLNLIGVNSQNFIEDLNKNFKNIFIHNIPIILTIIINLDLSYNFGVNLNNNYLLRNLSFLNNCLLIFKNHAYLNFFRKRKIQRLINYNRQEESIFLIRYYLNSDVFFCLFFILSSKLN